MPEISRFFGIVIYMYFEDHLPPHFHARYGDDDASIEIGTLRVLAGRLPRRAAALIAEWAAIHEQALRDDWACAEARQPLAPIAPLD